MVQYRCDGLYGPLRGGDGSGVPRLRNYVASSEDTQKAGVIDVVPLRRFRTIISVLTSFLLTSVSCPSPWLSYPIHHFVDPIIPRGSIESQTILTPFRPLSLSLSLSLPFSLILSLSLLNGR